MRVGECAQGIPSTPQHCFPRITWLQDLVITNLSSEYVDVSLIVLVLTALVVDTANWVVVVVAVQTAFTTRQLGGRWRPQREVLV